MSERLTLAEILGRDASIEWHEGVGLVRAVIERVLESHAEATAVPELQQIEIADDGRVEVIGVSTASDPVRRLGQLLQAILGHSSPPVQLRLAITQATAPTPSFGSIREFDEALAYFERPGRNLVLQALCFRAMAAPRSDDSTPPPTLDRMAPLPSTEPQKNADTRSSTNPGRHRLNAAAAAAILVLLCGAGAWSGRTAWTTRDASAMAAKASDVLGGAVVSGLSAVTERVGLGRLVSAESADGDSVAAVVATPPGQTSRARRPADSVDPPVAPAVLFDLDPLRADAADPVSAVPEPAVPSETTAQETASGAQPKLPLVLPSDVKSEFCRVDLIVSEDGTVESVRLVGASCTVRESMFLSAAKAWQFQPALKDGDPVRYRKTIWLAAR